jgi:CRP/FNR family transcriptional regulator, cyclic AMP receptor protein
MGHAGAMVIDRPSWADKLLTGRLEGGDLHALLEVSRAIRQPARTRLLRAEDDQVLLILRGTAKAHLVTAEGHQVITTICGPRSAAGVLTVLGYPSSGTDLTSLEPVDALAIAGRDLRALLAERSEITAACLSTVAAQLADSCADRARFAGTSITQRVAMRLLELATRWGRREGDQVHIMLSLTQEELASWSGASRESVAKVLQGMRNTGLLATGRRSLTVLDLPRLQLRCEGPASGSVHQLLTSMA